VILLWWPLVFPSDTVESWLVRGVLWTLCFELMLHAFAPVEESLWRTGAARRVARQAQAASARLGTTSPTTRFNVRWLVAGFALFVPLTLLASAPSHRLAPKPAAAQVRQVTQVKRIVRIERRSVTVPRSAVPRSSGAARGTGAAAGPAAAGYRPSVAGRSVAPRRTAAPGVSPRRPAGAGTHRAPSNGSPAAAQPTTTQPETPAGTPAAPVAGSDERSATAQIGQPKRRPLNGL
jgi:hypothetical protein